MRKSKEKSTTPEEEVVVPAIFTGIDQKPPDIGSVLSAAVKAVESVQQVPPHTVCGGRPDACWKHSCREYRIPCYCSNPDASKAISDQDRETAQTMMHRMKEATQ